MPWDNGSELIKHLSKSLTNFKHSSTTTATRNGHSPLFLDNLSMFQNWLCCRRRIWSRKSTCTEMFGSQIVKVSEENELRERIRKVFKQLKNLPQGRFWLFSSTSLQLFMFTIQVIWLFALSGETATCQWQSSCTTPSRQMVRMQLNSFRPLFPSYHLILSNPPLSPSSFGRGKEIYLDFRVLKE